MGGRVFETKKKKYQDKARIQRSTAGRLFCTCSQCASSSGTVKKAEMMKSRLHMATSFRVISCRRVTPDRASPPESITFPSQASGHVIRKHMISLVGRRRLASSRRHGSRCCSCSCCCCCLEIEPFRPLRMIPFKYCTAVPRRTLKTMQSA